MNIQEQGFRSSLFGFDKNDVLAYMNALANEAQQHELEYNRQLQQLQSKLDELRSEIRPDSIQINDHIAVIAVVGRKMAFRVGTSGKIFAALGKAGINIRMISQGPDELNIIVGVDTKDFAPAIQVLYNSFVK